MKRINFAWVVGAIALLLLITLAVAMPHEDRPVALAAPTPVSATYAGGISGVETFWDDAVLTTTGGSSVQNIQDHEAIDLHYVIDQGQTTINTTTLKLQFSNDNTNWTDAAAAIVTSNTADANVMQQYAIFGRYARVHATVTNSDPVTVTVIGIAK